jgi:hypothetical protein
MNRIKLLLLAFLFRSFSCLASEENFGVVASQNGALCVSFGGKPPPIGASIKILETQSPQYFFEGKLGNESESCKVLEKANVVGPYFLVQTEKKKVNPFVGVAVFSKNTLSVVNNEVVLSSASSKEKIYFRSCISNEGLHFSSWQGQPLKGEQLWRIYYYLGYDVEPSCQENELKK